MPAKTGAAAMSDPGPFPVPVSRAAALQMEGFWAKARLQSMALEQQILEMNKDPRVKRAMDVMADLGKARDDVGQYQDQVRRQTAKNETTRREIEGLRCQKAILEGSTREIGNWSPETLDCPCFRVSTRDFGGADSGYLSMAKGTVLLAICLEEDFFYGHEVHRPINCGWFAVSATSDLRREKRRAEWAAQGACGNSYGEIW